MQQPKLSPVWWAFDERSFSWNVWFQVINCRHCWFRESWKERT